MTVWKGIEFFSYRFQFKMCPHYLLASIKKMFVERWSEHENPSLLAPWSDRCIFKCIIHTASSGVFSIPFSYKSYQQITLTIVEKDTLEEYIHRECLLMFLSATSPLTSYVSTHRRKEASVPGAKWHKVIRGLVMQNFGMKQVRIRIQLHISKTEHL